ncbi:tetratricopeptide repeat protein [Taibaiella soli]|uniref:Uncharacterized protein n=1 Tax=Taibaiella soli TaxID=1649169 RepID=A0A2W2B1X9_9BACT|nr:tetratricopeptide repeat protein [Taibaiella soli]PZF74028.1 hypothetical protein DN068_04850 [Taibaiella soli]
MKKRYFFAAKAKLFLLILLSSYYSRATDEIYFSETAAPDSLFLVLKQKHSQAVKQHDEVTAAICLQQMGQLCYHLGHYSQALDYHLQAGDIFQETGKQKLLADNMSQTGILYYYTRRADLSRKQYEEALGIYRKLNDTIGIAQTYGEIGHLYEKQGAYDSSFHFQRQAVQQFRLAKDTTGIAKIFENLGSVYEDLERYDSALHYFQKALFIYQQTKNRLAGIEVLNNLGDVYRKTGHYREGLEQTQLALRASLALHETYQTSSAYRDLGKTYNLMGMNDSAYHYLELGRKLQQEIYSKENNKQVAFLQVLYDMERKNHEIEKLQIQRRATTFITIAVIVVILLLVVLGMLVISRQRMKIRIEQAQNEQNKRIYDAKHGLMQAELVNKKLQEEQLTQDLEQKSKELTTHTLHIIQKNQLLDDLRNKLEEMVNDEKRDQKKQLKSLLQQINQSFNHEQYWKEFHNIFEQVHQKFFDNLKRYCADLTANDFRLVALLKMNLSSDNIATLLGISQDSLRVSRYRLRKKLGLEQGENLSAFLQQL